MSGLLFHRLLPYAFILTAGIIWGGTFSLVLIATADGTHPVTLTAWQVILASILFILICLWTRKPIFVMGNLHIYGLIAALGIILPGLLYYSAAPHLSAGILSITVSTVPMFTYALMWLLRFERLVLKRALGIILGMVSILLLVVPDHGLASENANVWVLVVVICALCYAAENVYLGEGIREEIDIRELLSGSNIVAAIVISMGMWGFGYDVPAAWFFTASAGAIFGIAISSTVAYLIFFYTIQKFGSVFASQVAYLVTISGVIWGMVIFSERHTIWVWISIAVLIAGLALVSPRKKRGRRLHSKPGRDEEQNPSVN